MAPSNRFALVACCIVLQQSATSFLLPSRGKWGQAFSRREVIKDPSSGTPHNNPLSHAKGSTNEEEWDFPANQFNNEEEEEGIPTRSVKSFRPMSAFPKSIPVPDFKKESFKPETADQPREVIQKKKEAMSKADTIDKVVPAAKKTSPAVENPKKPIKPQASLRPPAKKQTEDEEEEPETIDMLVPDPKRINSAEAPQRSQKERVDVPAPSTKQEKEKENDPNTIDRKSHINESEKPQTPLSQQEKQAKKSLNQPDSTSRFMLGTNEDSSVLEALPLPPQTIKPEKEPKGSVNQPNTADKFMYGPPTAQASEFKEEKFQRWQSPEKTAATKRKKDHYDPMNQQRWEQIDKFTEDPSRFQVPQHPYTGVRKEQGQPDRLDKFLQDPRSSQASQADRSTMSEPTPKKVLKRQATTSTMNQPTTLNRFQRDPLHNAASQADRFVQDPSKFEIYKKPSSQKEMKEKEREADVHPDLLDRFMEEPTHEDALQAQRFSQDPSSFMKYQHPSPKRAKATDTIAGDEPDTTERFMDDPVHADESQTSRYREDPTSFQKWQRPESKNTKEKETTVDDPPDPLDRFMDDPSSPEASQADRFEEDPSSFEKYQHPTPESKGEEAKVEGQPDTIGRFMEDPTSPDASQADRFRDDPVKFQRLQQIDRFEKDPDSFEVWERPAGQEKTPTSSADRPEIDESELELINHWPSHLPSPDSLQGPDPNHQQRQQIDKFKEDPAKFQKWERPSASGTESKDSSAGPLTTGLPRDNPVTAGQPEDWGLQRQDARQWQQVDRYSEDPNRFVRWKRPQPTSRDVRSNHNVPGQQRSSDSSMGLSARFQQQQQIDRFTEDPRSFKLGEDQRRQGAGHADQDDRFISDPNGWHATQADRIVENPDSSKTPQVEGYADQDDRFISDPNGWHAAQADRMAEDPDRSKIPQVDRFKQDPSKFQRWERAQDTSAVPDKPDQVNEPVEDHPTGFQSRKLQRWQRGQALSQPDQANGFVDNPWGSKSAPPSISYIPDPSKLVRPSPTDDYDYTQEEIREPSASAVSSQSSRQEEDEASSSDEALKLGEAGPKLAKEKKLSRSEDVKEDVPTDDLTSSSVKRKPKPQQDKKPAWFSNPAKPKTKTNAAAGGGKVKAKEQKISQTPSDKNVTGSDFSSASTPEPKPDAKVIVVKTVSLKDTPETEPFGAEETKPEDLGETGIGKKDFYATAATVGSVSMPKQTGKAVKNKDSVGWTKATKAQELQETGSDKKTENVTAANLTGVSGSPPELKVSKEHAKRTPSNDKAKAQTDGRKKAKPKKLSLTNEKKEAKDVLAASASAPEASAKGGRKKAKPQKISPTSDKKEAKDILAASASTPEASAKDGRNKAKTQKSALTKNKKEARDVRVTPSASEAPSTPPESSAEDDAKLSEKSSRKGNGTLEAIAKSGLNDAVTAQKLSSKGSEKKATGKNAPSGVASGSFFAKAGPKVDLKQPFMPPSPPKSTTKDPVKAEGKAEAIRTQPSHSSKKDDEDVPVSLSIDDLLASELGPQEYADEHSEKPTSKTLDKEDMSVNHRRQGQEEDTRPQDDWEMTDPEYSADRLESPLYDDYDPPVGPWVRPEDDPLVDPWEATDRYDQFDMFDEGPQDYDYAREKSDPALRPPPNLMSQPGPDQRWEQMRRAEGPQPILSRRSPEPEATEEM